jgi:radical SAM superfamily enzyme YgiQ (UPF0313 family)
MVLAGLSPPEWEITIVDENLGVRDYPAMPRPDLVGITAFTSRANRAYDVAAHFRSLGVPMVMGGIHATMCLDEAVERVDSVVTMEAERVWPQVLEDSRQGCLKRYYDGGFAEIDRVPPARHDLLTGAYAMGAIQTTRGCPMNCTFWSVTPFNGAHYRLRPIPDVVREFQLIREKRVLVVGSFIIGLDNDRPGIGKRIAAAANLYGVDNLNAMFLTPLPGTRLWNQMKSEGRIALDTFPEEWKYYTLTFQVARYKHFPLDNIIEEMISCDQKFYSMPRILCRVWSNLWQRRSPLIAMLGALSYRSNLQLNCRAYAEFKCQQGYRFTGRFDVAESFEQSMPGVGRWES